MPILCSYLRKIAEVYSIIYNCDKVVILSVTI